MKMTTKQRFIKITSIFCLLALILSCIPVMNLGVSATAPNMTYKATVEGNAVSIEKSGTRDNSNYAAFEMDPYQNIEIEFVGKNMPTVRFLTNEVTNNTNTAGTGALVRGDANNRLEIRNGYGNASGADVKAEMGIDKLVDGTQYKMVYEINRSDGININQVAAVLYESDGNGGWTKTYDRTHNMTVETLGCDLTKPLYVVFYNNLYSDGATATEFTYLRPSAMDEGSVSWDEATSTLSWSKLIGADGYFVKLDDGEWTETEALSHTFGELSGGTHTLSVCANIGGTKGAAVVKEIEVAQPAGEGASRNTTYKATVEGNAISVEKSGTRDNSNYAAFEMDPYQDITIEFVGKNMPTVRFMTNEITKDTNTAGTGSLVRGDANNRLEIRDGYGNASGADVNASWGINSLVDGTKYKMVYQVLRADGTNISGVNVEIYAHDGTDYVKQVYRSHNTTLEKLGCDLSQPLYVVFYNNLYSDGATATEFTYLRPSALDESKVILDDTTNTLSWSRLIGADGYFVKLDEGEWLTTDTLSHTFGELSGGTHTLSVCANIGGTKGTAVVKEIEIAQPAGEGASLNTTYKATVNGNAISVEKSGTRDNSNYAAFEIDPTKDIEIEFVGKNMPTVRFMSNEVTNNTSTAGTGILIRGDANSRLEIHECYGDMSGAAVQKAMGVDKLVDGTQYKMVFKAPLLDETTIDKVTVLFYEYVNGSWVPFGTEDGELTRNNDIPLSQIGVDFTEPVYVVFYNNLYGDGATATEFTYLRPSALDESSVVWNDEASTLSWSRLPGADGYFVKLDNGEWIATDALFHTFADLSDDMHTVSVCANIGGEKGVIVSKTVNLGDTVILKDSASIRVDGTPGLRFTAYIAEGYLETLQDGQAGILIHRGALTEELTAENCDMLGQAINWAMESDVDGYRKFSCVIINVPEAYYALDLVARAYISHTVGDELVYQYSDTTLTRSLAQVASTALCDAQYANNEVPTQFVDGAVESIAITGSNTIGINRTEQLTLTVTGKAGLAEGSSLDNIKAIWSTSDASVATVDENGVVKAHGIGEATITAVVGSAQNNFVVTVGMYRATENTDGTIMLNGSPDNGETAAYYVMDYCAADVNTLYEVSWTGKNFPGLWLGAREERGTYKTEGTGVIVTWDNSYGLAVSSNVYGSGRTAITNQAGQSGANWTLNTLDDNTKYVMRVGFVANTESNSEYRLQIYVWSVDENGAMTLLNKKTTSDNYANGVVSGTEYYMLLVNNRAHNPNTFSWRKVIMAGATVSGSASTMGQMYLGSNSGSQTAMNYFVTDHQDGDYVEVTFSKGGMPIIRFGYGTVTADSTASGGATGFMLTNAYNSTSDTTGGSVAKGDLTCWNGYYANGTRTNFGDESFGVSDLNTAAGTYMVRAGLKNQGDGNYTMVAYFYQVNSDGTLTQMNTVTQSGFTVQFGENPYIQIMGNRQTNTQCDWVIKNGGFIESELQFGLYGYAGPSNGQHYENGVAVTDSETGFQNQAGYDTYAAAGMNILMLDADTRWSDTTAEQNKVLEILGYAENAGLKVILHDSRINTLSLSTAEYAGFASQDALNQKIAEYMQPYAQHPAFYGLQIDDEPSYQQFPAIGAIYKAVKAYDGDCYVQCNLLPLNEGSYTSYTANATAAGYETAYISYLTAWLDATGADYVMFDSYPFLDDQIRDDHIRGLQLAANLCRERGVELCSVAQAGAWTKGNGGEVIRRAPTEADMYWQTNLLMGMGVKKIAYFTYQTKKNNTDSEWFVDGASFVKWDGTTTPLYTAMQKIHAGMQLLAPTILRYDFVDMAVYGKSGVFTKNHVIENVQSASAWHQITDVSSGVGAVDYNSTLFISEMYNEATGQYGYMIINLSENNKGTTMTPTITFSSNEIAVYRNGERSMESLTNGTYQVSLSYGEAVFVVVQN